MAKRNMGSLTCFSSSNSTSTSSSIWGGTAVTTNVWRRAEVLFTCATSFCLVSFRLCEGVSHSHSQSHSVPSLPTAIANMLLKSSVLKQSPFLRLILCSSSKVGKDVSRCQGDEGLCSCAECSPSRSPSGSDQTTNKSKGKECHLLKVC